MYGGGGVLGVAQYNHMSPLKEKAVQGPRWKQWQEWPPGVSKHLEPSVPHPPNKLKELEGHCSPEPPAGSATPTSTPVQPGGPHGLRNVQKCATISGCGFKVVSL